MKRKFPPLFWFHVPEAVMRGLRELGFDDGISVKCKSDVDVESFIENHLQRNPLNSLSQPCYPSLWFESLNNQILGRIRKRFRDCLIEVEAGSLEEALHKTYLSRHVFGIFYHVACMPGWEEIAVEQLDLLSKVGLDRILVSLLGTDADKQIFENLAKERNVEVEVLFNNSDFKLFEAPAMQMIQEWCRARSDGYILYFHTKGVSKPHSRDKQLWRRLMSRYVIELWRDNCQKLHEGYDAVGVGWRLMPPISHFPGNFFLAKVSYVKTLSNFEDHYMHPRYDATLHGLRLGAEFWLGTGRKTPKVFSHVTTNEAMDVASFWVKYHHLL